MLSISYELLTLLCVLGVVLTLLELSVLDRKLSLVMAEDGLQHVYIDDRKVSEVSLAEVYSDEIVHRFSLMVDEKIAALSLNLQAKGDVAAYQLWLDNKQVQSGEIPLQGSVAPVKRKQGLWGLFALGFKLLKSVKVIKVALAATSVAGYAWLFTFEFAVVLVACLVAHEYGHVLAMKYFGIKTKGIYIIPFVGGLAVSDDKINTRWQDVVISIMGPCFGLFMSLACLVAYAITGLELLAGAAVIGSLLNLFNLLPILPLDGGHVLKSISFSMRSWIGLAACALGIGAGVFISYYFGLMLLVFFLVIGAIETYVQWNDRHKSSLIPLDRYGQVISALWYLLLIVGHVGVVVAFADSENPILSLPMKILSS
ncbi:MAG: Zn-dependent protease [Flavobacteriales bacterium]|jgi:Zn-dependent protease